MRVHRGLGEDYPGITSVVVSRVNEIVHEQYPDGDVSMLRDTRSCTNTVLGMLVGIAVHKGMGGNRVQVFPDLELAAVITTRNFKRAGAHDVTDQLLVNEVLDGYGT